MKMTNKKKSTSGEAPILRRDYGTTPGGKVQWLAEILFDMIGEKPMKRPKNPGVDRMLRKLIEEANMKGDCIINNGTGYYRPNPENEIDEYAYHLYRTKEMARARTIISKIEAMDKAFNGRYQ